MLYQSKAIKLDTESSKAIYGRDLRLIWSSLD